jgi:hypothetical protein
MEIWKPILGFEGFYECSSFGNFRSVRGGKGTRFHKPIKTWQSDRGYARIELRVNRKRHKVFAHRLIAKTFFGDSDLTVNHKNGIRHDNRIENLEFLSSGDNTRHAARITGRNQGEKHGRAKLNNADAKAIRIQRESGQRVADIAKQYGVARSTISMLLTGKNWSSI